MDIYTQLSANEKFPEIDTIYKHTGQPFLIAATRDKMTWHSELVRQLLAENQATVLLLLLIQEDAVLLRCLSETDEVRALELLDYLFGQYGILKGDAKDAKGSMSQVLLHVCMSELDLNDISVYFRQRAADYFAQIQIIYAQQYVKENEELVKEMTRYQKRRISWAYVKTTDIGAPGKQIGVRTLENDTGVTLQVHPDTYIMIGCRGEVYEISREKFQISYEPSEQPLDIFTQQLDFIPAVETLPEHEYITIDEIAHLCYPRQGAQILAKRLTQRTKVFGRSSRDYFIGKPGDYMAIRCDDLQDIYIIQDAVFDRTYEALMTAVI